MNDIFICQVKTYSSAGSSKKVKYIKEFCSYLLGLVIKDSLDLKLLKSTLENAVEYANNLYPRSKKWELVSFGRNYSIRPEGKNSAYQNNNIIDINTKIVYDTIDSSELPKKLEEYIEKKSKDKEGAESEK